MHYIIGHDRRGLFQDPKLDPTGWREKSRENLSIIFLPSPSKKYRARIYAGTQEFVTKENGRKKWHPSLKSQRVTRTTKERFPLQINADQQGRGCRHAAPMPSTGVSTEQTQCRGYAGISHFALGSHDPSGSRGKYTPAQVTPEYRLCVCRSRFHPGAARCTPTAACSPATARPLGSLMVRPLQAPVSFALTCEVGLLLTCLASACNKDPENLAWNKEGKKGTRQINS